MDIEKLMNDAPKDLKTMLADMLMEAMIESAGENEKSLFLCVKSTRRISQIISDIVDKSREDMKDKDEVDLSDEKGEAWRTMLQSIEAAINILETALEECGVGRKDIK